MRHDVRWLLGIGVTVVAVAAIAYGASAPASAEAGLQSGDTGSGGAGRVLPGIDVLLTDSLQLIAGKRLGLITNQTGVDAQGVSTIDRLNGVSSSTQHPAPSTRLIALFAPEHGIRGLYAPGESVRDTAMGVNDTLDVATGLPIYSLYGPRRAPSRAQFDLIDVLVVDLQDIGVRTFTYVSTMVEAMRAAHDAGKRVIVLDRPNPIGCTMQGPVLDTAYASFIGMLPVPLRHGLTMGELARFANGELHLGTDLVVVPVKGWRRCDWFDRTGLPWVRPSPNLPDLEAVAWYPGTVLFEATNLSVGRGTDHPFTQLGAPWFDWGLPLQLLRFRNVHAQAVRVTPQAPGDGKYAGVEIRAVRFGSLDRRRQDPIAIAVWLMEALAAQQTPAFEVDTLGLFRRLGMRWIPGRSGVCNATDCDDWSSFRWDDQVNAFRRRVRPYLLYQ